MHNMNPYSSFFTAPLHYISDFLLKGAWVYQSILLAVEMVPMTLVQEKWLPS